MLICLKEMYKYTVALVFGDRLEVPLSTCFLTWVVTKQNTLSHYKGTASYNTGIKCPRKQTDKQALLYNVKRADILNF